VNRHGFSLLSSKPYCPDSYQALFLSGSRLKVKKNSGKIEGHFPYFGLEIGEVSLIHFPFVQRPERALSFSFSDNPLTKPAAVSSAKFGQLRMETVDLAEGSFQYPAPLQNRVPLAHHSSPVFFCRTEDRFPLSFSFLLQGISSFLTGDVSDGIGGLRLHPGLFEQPEKKDFFNKPLMFDSLFPLPFRIREI
jgi:hypothetical protein